MDAISGAGTTYPSGEPEFTHGFSRVRVTRCLVFCVMFCRSLFCFSFHLRILIAPFGIFKLLLDYMCMDIYTRVPVCS